MQWYCKYMEEVAKSCFDTIVQQTKRPLLVGIGGDSGSGKSYLTSIIAQHFGVNNLSCAVINHDEFLIPRKDREPMKTIFYTKGKFAGKSHWEVLENMFRLDEMKRVILALKAGNRVSYTPYARETGALSEQIKTIEPADFIIFDSSMLLEEMDFVIIVEVSQENIIKRKLARDSDIRTPEEIIEMHRKVQGYYWLDRGWPKRPNIIIDNNDFQKVKLTKR